MIFDTDRDGRLVDNFCGAGGLNVRDCAQKNAGTPPVCTIAATRRLGTSVFMSTSKRASELRIQQLLAATADQDTNAAAATVTATPIETTVSKTSKAQKTKKTVKQEPTSEMPVWWTYDSVCAYIEASRRTVDQWRKDGRFIPARKLPNGELRFRAADVVAWMDEQVAA